MSKDAKTEPNSLTEDFIEKHNAEMASLRAEHYPRVDALTDEECERIYRRWVTPGIGMSANQIAIEFRDELGMTWPEDIATGIGIKLIHTVLTRLDKFDPDFRPSPEPQHINDIGKGSIWYLPSVHKYQVKLGELNEEFPASYAPKFGIDVLDMEAAHRAMERLEASSSSADTSAPNPR